MPANMENSAVATGPEKVSFHSNPKEGQCQRMFKLPHNCIHLVAQTVKVSAYNAGNPGSIPGWGRSLEKAMATRSNICAWRISWTEESGRLQSMESQRVRCN